MNKRAIVAAVSALGIIDRHCIVGGAAMALRGVRICKSDIDVLVSHPTFQVFEGREGWFPGISGPTNGCLRNNNHIDLLDITTFPNVPNIDRYLGCAQTIGPRIRLIRLDDLLEWKLIANRPKDQADIRLLRERL